ncbi:hypothetical protein [Rivularia sp. UHCC 0363]|uniref:hypothetical protein n=1 Tax=Rivularia sp. UHCC 0363 TaxID=3110244 RepID=UPI002B20D236|nr:hypothetical protein [Rivularia sp. UHCC 0363]MEA5599126.1 hypothetical protein [Rivularia sp. UHCC 0363]
MATDICSTHLPIEKPGYRAQADDTCVETDLFFFGLLQLKTTAERLKMGLGMVQSARRLSFHCLSQQFSHLAPEQLAHKIATAWLQEDYPDDFPLTVPNDFEMSWIQDSTDITVRLHHILSNLGIAYYVTGGVAAIAYGEPRTTRDVDLVLEIELAQIDELVTALMSNGFYVPGAEDVKAGRMRSLSVTHIESVSRADLVVSGTGAFEQIRFQRRRLIAVPSGEQVYFSSPEDIILAKLLWGQRSGSEKQWRDVLGVLKVQQTALDYGYLAEWAEHLELGELLSQALVQAGI